MCIRDSGSIDDDHKFLYLLNFFRFQWFDQRHVSVETQTIGIEIVIKTVTVSYTHLDVYKRQEEYMILSQLLNWSLLCCEILCLKNLLCPPFVTVIENIFLHWKNGKIRP